MPKKPSGEFNEYQYQQEYIKQHLKFVNVNFNALKPDDMELYDWLNKRPQELGESKASYIKRLIRADMEESGG